MSETAMTEERFVAIFKEEGLDDEWARICWGRAIKLSPVDALTETIVREAARSWAKDDGF